MTSVFLKSISEPTTPDPSMLFIEKDSAIVRGVTLAMYDLSNAESYQGSGNVLDEAAIGNLVAGGDDTTINTGNAGSYYPPVLNGTLRTAGSATTFGTPAGIRLPVSCCLPADTTRSLAVLWARAPKTGWTANFQGGIFGVGANVASAADTQHGLWLLTDAGGVVKQLQYRVANSGGFNLDLPITGALLDDIFDGDLHQIACEISIANGVFTRRLYVDQALIGTASDTTANTLKVPPTTKTGVFGSCPGVSPMTDTNKAQDFRFGRFSIHNLSARPDLTVAQMLAADMAAADGFVS